MLHALYYGVSSFFPGETPVPRRPVEFELPEPEHDDTLPQVRLKQDSFAFPSPLLRMPFERDRATCLEYLREDEKANVPTVVLPVYFRAEVMPLREGGDCSLIATCNRKLYARGGDGLTAYGSVHRPDYTFRLGVFARRFLRTVTLHSRTLLRLREWNEMSMVLSQQQALYWINGKKVASVHFASDEVIAAELSVGLASYDTSYMFRGFDVSRDPRILRLVCSPEEIENLHLWRGLPVTLHACLVRTGVVAVSCRNMAGEELAHFEELPASTSFSHVKNEIVSRVSLDAFERVQFIASTGEVLDTDSLESLAVVLQLGECTERPST
eukprot:TRINITY_DN7964_c0_g1_i1.p1 TRINITY_DN7964_c0_g1~~TRINITY_DN7964_c0_g1_i1.p1  ORF type:complete len:326 (-),score=27.59 TRINITY_DN7964_c0_g1_i1:358-1335(-)